MTGQRIRITIIWQVIPKTHPVITDDQPLFRTLFSNEKIFEKSFVTSFVIEIYHEVLTLQYSRGLQQT